MISRIFRVDGEDDTHSRAARLESYLVEAQKPQQVEIKINDFHKGKPHPLIEPGKRVAFKELQNVFFIGHSQRNLLDRGGLLSDAVTYSGYTARDFVTKFAEPFSGENKNKKNTVENIYLIGCELGLSNENENDSFAQAVADEFFQQGFKKVEVHALAYARQADESIYVEVIDCVAAGDAESKPGYISAFRIGPSEVAEIALLEKKAAEERSKLDSLPTIKRVTESMISASAVTGLENGQLGQRERAIEAILKHAQKAGNIVHNAPPLKLFKEAKNTFIARARETYLQRKKRIAADPFAIELNKKAQAIIDIQRHMAKKGYALDEDKQTILKNLVTKLGERYNESSGEEICSLYRDTYKRHLSKWRWRTPKSSTLQLLDELSEKILISPTTESSTHLENRARTSGSSPPFSSETRTSKSRFFKGPARTPTPRTEVNGLAEKKEIPGHLIREIDGLIDELRGEIVELEAKMKGGGFTTLFANYFNVFLDFEKETKEKKRDCLLKLRTAQTLEQMQAFAKLFVKDKDSRVMRHYKNTSTGKENFTRTGNLLHKVINNPHAIKVSHVEMVARRG